MLDKYSEKVLKHISHYQLNHYEGNAIPNFQSHIDKIKNVNPKYVRNILKQLDTLGYVTADMNANHIGSVSLTHLGELYFSSKRTEQLRSWIQFWIPVIISLIALFRPEMTTLIEYIIKLCSQ